MDALTPMSAATLSVADVRANLALCLERGGDAVRNVFGELAGDAHRRYHLSLAVMFCPKKMAHSRMVAGGKSCHSGYETMLVLRSTRCWFAITTRGRGCRR